MNNKILPTFLSKPEYMNKASRLPVYKAEQRMLPMEQRLLLLDTLYSIYVPTDMSFEVYSKLFVALSRSLNKKFSREAILQRYENHNLIVGRQSNGLIGGGDSILITGKAGIGKSSAIDGAIRLLSDKIIEFDTTRVIPILEIQCPFDCSIKSMLTEIIRNTDRELGSDYLNSATGRKSTTDELIGLVSQIALNHIGVIVIDEIQNVVTNSHGANLIGALTQLINNSATSIVMVGTPESRAFFEKAEFFARRAIGLNYDRNDYNDEFCAMVSTVLSYNYTRHKAIWDENTIAWIYEHSAGLPSNVIALIHDAQEIALTRGIESLSSKTLEMAFNERMQILHSYIDNKPIKVRKTKGCKGYNRKKAVNKSSESWLRSIINSSDDIIKALSEHIEVEEV